MTTTIDLYCRVVDNLGDAGVCWRLARQLVREHGHAVRMWIDEPAALARIEPGLDIDRRVGAEAVATGADTDDRPGAEVRGVRLRHWRGAGEVDDHAGDIPQVVIAAFGCELPPSVRRSLAGAPRRPLWIHLEYLSAEPWVDGCHRLASVKPADGAVEWFFYPGFTSATGGLLREAGLFDERDRFRAEGGAASFLRRLGVEVADDGARRMSLFCYPQTVLSPWLTLLADDPRPTRMLVPDGVADASVSAFAGRVLSIGETAGVGSLSMTRIPFVPQDDYDRLLWSCDFNVVRGEDSWIRAQWAARPFVWLPYPQSGDTHRVKLDAFLARLAPVVGEHATALGRAWDGRTNPRTAWDSFERVAATAPARYATWADSLAAGPDLAASLDRFIRDRL